MIYVNNDYIVILPKQDNTEVGLLKFENQITKTMVDMIVEDTSNSEVFYRFNIEEYRNRFINGQYDYTLLDAQGNVILTGIAQIGDFTNQFNKYAYEYNQTIITYDLEDTNVQIPLVTQTIINNGEYDVRGYDEVIVNVDEHLDDIERLEGEIEDLEGTIAEKEKEIGWLEENLSETIAERDYLLGELEKAGATNENLRLEIQTLQDNINILQGEISALEAAKTALESEVEALRAEIAEKTAKITELEAEVSSLTNTINAANTTIENLNNTITQKEAEITNLTNDLNEAYESMDLLTTQVENLQKSLEDCMRDCNLNCEADIAALNAQIQNLNGQIQTLNNTITDKNTQIQTLQAEISKLNEDKVNLQLEVDNLTDRVNTLESENSALEGQVEGLEIQVQNLNTEITQLNTQIEGLLLEKQQLTTQVENLQGEIEEKNTQIATLQTQVADLQATIENLDAYIETATSITITENGTYTTPSGCIGYNEIVVEVVPKEPEFVPEYLEFYNFYQTFSDKFYLEYVTDGTISPNFEYSRNGKDWFVWDYSQIEVVSHVYLRGVNNTQISDENNYLYCIGDTYSVRPIVEVRGNIMTLVDGEGRTKTIPDENMFAYLFKGFGDKFTNTAYSYDLLFYAGDLKLPASELTIGCYKYMFANTSLYYSYVPRVLPAKVLQFGCYEGMFENTEITIAPILLGEYLVGTENNTGCYARMFYNCKKLKRVYCFNKGWTTYPNEGVDACGSRHYDTYEWMRYAGSEASDCYVSELGMCQFICREETLCAWKGMMYSSIQNDKCAFPINWEVSPIDFNFLFEDLEIEDLL